MPTQSQLIEKRKPAQILHQIQQDNNQILEHDHFETSLGQVFNQLNKIATTNK